MIRTATLFGYQKIVVPADSLQQLELKIPADDAANDLIGINGIFIFAVGDERVQGISFLAVLTDQGAMDRRLVVPGGTPGLEDFPVGRAKMNAVAPPYFCLAFKGDVQTLANPAAAAITPGQLA